METNSAITIHPSFSNVKGFLAIKGKGQSHPTKFCKICAHPIKGSIHALNKHCNG